MLAKKQAEHGSVGVYLLCDCSGSMSGERIALLNMALEKGFARLQELAGDYPGLSIHLNAIRFASQARWHLQNRALEDRPAWPSIQDTGGLTCLGAALQLLAQHFQQQPPADGQLPPLILLLTDGKSTDEIAHGLEQLLATPQGQHAQRFSIGIGEEVDREMLLELVGQHHSRLTLTASSMELPQLINGYLEAGLRQADQLRQPA